QIIGLYTDNDVLVQSTMKTLNVINVSMFFFCAAFILFNCVTGTGNTRASLLIEVINIAIYLSAAVIIVKFFNPPIHLVWCAEFIYFGFLALMSWAYLKKGNWQNKEI